VLNIITLPVGQLKANCYLVYEENASDCIIIDPGDEADFIMQKINDYGLTLVGIVATHAHFDHIKGVIELKWAFNIPFYLHAKDQALLAHYRRSAMYFTNYDPGPPPIPDVYLKDKDTIGQGVSEFKVIQTPGHTPGSICLYNKKEGIIFTGDTLFAGGGVGRTDHSYSNPLNLGKSIQKILTLPDNTIILSGHGEATTVLNEKEYHLI